MDADRQRLLDERPQHPDALYNTVRDLDNDELKATWDGLQQLVPPELEFEIDVTLKATALLSNAQDLGASAYNAVLRLYKDVVVNELQLRDLWDSKKAGR